jgi:hypothetical protein
MIPCTRLTLRQKRRSLLIAEIDFDGGGQQR